MIVAGPGYISHKQLPLVSDIFYHGKLTYLLPTGTNPDEWKTVIGFPDYCYQNSIAFPQIIWDMCKLYFENNENAVKAINMLEPLRSDLIRLAATIYPRGRVQIESVLTLLERYPVLLERFDELVFDRSLAARELLSHVLYEIFLVEGYKGAVDYLQFNTRTPDRFFSAC
jgi:hypothetical protein